MSPRHPASRKPPASQRKPQFPFSQIPEQIFNVVPYIDNPKYDPANGMMKLEADWQDVPATTSNKAHKSLTADLPQGPAAIRVMQYRPGLWGVYVTDPEYKGRQRKQHIARDLPNEGRAMLFAEHWVEGAKRNPEFTGGSQRRR